MQMEKSYCVVIIGAGLAGLACAKYLIEHQIEDFLILEASEHIGGRCQTIQFDEEYIELGAEVLHGQQSNNPLYQLAEEHRLLADTNIPFDRDAHYHDEDAQSIDEDIINESRKIYEENFQRKMPCYPYENYPDMSLGEFLSRDINHYLQVKKFSLNQREFHRREKVMHWLEKEHHAFHMLTSEKLTDVSLQGWNSFERLETDENIKYLKNGFSHFFKTAFVNKITLEKIQFNSPVTRMSMDQDEGPIQIEILQDNHEIIICHAQHVVCTQSLGCLKRTINKLFVPSLPFGKQLAIERLGFGTINKIYLIFSQPFWDVDFHRFHFLWNLNSNWKFQCLEKTPYHSQWCRNITGFHVHQHHSNTLFTQVIGDAGKYIETIPDQLLIACFQELFSRFYPDNPIPKPRQLIRSQWSSKSNIHGSHTFIALGSSIHDIKQYALPCLNRSNQPRILFAGEGTHEQFYGTAHGAFLSGIREGKRIVQLYQ